MTRRSRAREVALQLLFQRDVNPTVSRPAVEEFARARLLEKDDLVAFCLTLYDGVVAHAAENGRLPRMAAVDRNVLRLGAYELLFGTDTPPKVALDEAIELVRRYGDKDSPAFVNGVLDRLHQVQIASRGLPIEEQAASASESPASGADESAIRNPQSAIE